MLVIIKLPLIQYTYYFQKVDGPVARDLLNLEISQCQSLKIEFQEKNQMLVIDEREVAENFTLDINSQTVLWVKEVNENPLKISISYQTVQKSNLNEKKYVMTLSSDFWKKTRFCPVIFFAFFLQSLTFVSDLQL